MSNLFADGAGLAGVLGACGGIYAMVDGLRKRRIANRDGQLNYEQVVVRSAVDLLEPYRQRANQLEDRLAQAEAHSTTLRTRLDVAERRATDLAGQLADAQTEVAFLRTQVRHLTKANEQDGP